ncbi:MAG: class IV adenylate cyclase [Anaerolineae bacterium]|nr:class IV adenylate cyclase [Anaerolineae bacterium]
MSGYQEIEVKFVLDDPAAMRNRLLRLGAASYGRRFENNLRLDDVERSLAERHIVLRLRESEGADGVSIQLTVKSPAASSDASLSFRNEFELEIGDGAAMLAALEVLGYKPYWRYEKRRETFVLGDVEAVIDELPFGWFMEIEGSPEGIQALAKKLCLDMADGITSSYARIFEYVCQTLNLDPGDLTFDAFKNIDVDIRILKGLMEGT